MSITHTTSATGTDSGDGKISKDAWNEAHTGLPAFSGARVYASGTVNGTGSTFTVTFDSEDFDTDAYHSTGSNTERLTAPATGYYEVGWVAEVPSGYAAANSRLGYRIDGGTEVAFGSFGATHQYIAWGASATSGPVYLTSGQYVELRYLADSGHNISAGMRFWIKRLG